MARTAARLYVPLDLMFFRDRKVKAVGEKAAWLYLRMLVEAKQLDSDGILSAEQIEDLRVPGWNKRLVLLMEGKGCLAGEDPLVAEMPMAPGIYLLPAWLKWNESKEARAERLAEDRRRKAKGKETPQ